VSVASVADRACAYGMPGVCVPENDPLQVFEAVGEAVARARRGEGPTLIEVKTFRYFGHFQGDAEVYRSQGRGEASACARPDPEACREAEAGWRADGAKRRRQSSRGRGSAWMKRSPSPARVRIPRRKRRSKTCSFEGGEKWLDVG